MNTIRNCDSTKTFSSHPSFPSMLHSLVEELIAKNSTNPKTKKMRRILGVLAVAIFTLGMFSCEPENTVDETDALYKLDRSANDEDQLKGGNGSGGG